MVKTKKLEAEVDCIAATHELGELKEQNAKERDKLNVTLMQFFANVIKYKNLKWLGSSYAATLIDAWEEILRRS